MNLMRSFVEETGACPTDLSAKAKKIGNGRWEVKLKAYRNGEQRTLDATAVMDKMEMFIFTQIKEVESVVLQHHWAYEAFGWQLPECLRCS